MRACSTSGWRAGGSAGTARCARFYGISRLGGVQASRPALFSGATFSGRVNMRDARFEGRVSFQHATSCGEVAFGGASVGTFIDVETTSTERRTGAITVAGGSRVAGDPATSPLAGLPPSPLRAGA